MMASLTSASRPLLSILLHPPFTSLPVRPFSTTFSRPRSSETGKNSCSVDSPLRGAARDKSCKVPDFGDYRSKQSPNTNLNFQYFMVGAMGALTAAGAKATVQDFLVNLSMSGDVLAIAKIQVDLSAIPVGRNVILKWRGKPVFIRHRTAREIEDARKVKVESLRDPERDEDRVKRPEWLVVIGVCTHLGCVPVGEAGDFGGWLCYCHGSHYDVSGRVRKGPAPLNLRIPEHDFPEDTILVIG